MAALFIGLMSGTSMDGIDGVLAELSDDSAALKLVVRAHARHGFEPRLGAELLALNTPQGEDELHRSALAANALARAYASVIEELLRMAVCAPGDVAAIGVHGQTVRHRPRQYDATGYTLQLNNPALLAELTGIDVIADFRSRDIAAGGQGAPLVPAFHQALFARPGVARAVLNLGGIANLTLLAADGEVRGFDCGPASVLLDLWSRRHRGAPYDAGGRWAAQGQVHAALLATLRADPFFALPPPKSTGRDLFHARWLDDHLKPLTGVAAVDVQATLAELSALACAEHLQRHLPDARELLVCGGGAFNDHLMARIAAHLPGVRVEPTSAHGLPPDQVEACAFAWLAERFVRRRAGNLVAVTGARGPRVLGALYPADVQ